jgi:hypothetical protein
VPTESFDEAVAFYGEVLDLPCIAATAPFRALSSRPGT